MQEENSFNNNPGNEQNTSGNPFDTKPAKKGSNINLVLTIINVIMLVGLAILYFIVLKPGNNMPEKAMKKASSGNISIAYVNSDSILVHYALVKQMRDELEKNTSKLESELKNRQSAFEKDAAYFQEQVNKKSISEASAQQVYGSLMEEQQKLVELRERYSSELAKQEYDMNVLLMDSLNNFLERYNTKMNFDYIFSYNKGGSILRANDSLDITQEVLRLLNEEYEQNK